MTQYIPEYSGWTVSELAAFFDGKIVGNYNSASRIFRPAPLDEAGVSDLAYYADRRYADKLASTNASCVLVNSDFSAEPPNGTVFIKVADPHRSFVRFLGLIESCRPKHVAAIHTSAVIDSSAIVSSSAIIMAGCIIGAECVIGENTLVYPNVVLYDGVKIGNDTVLHAGVICGSQTEIGDRCIIQPGAVIGADGFGYLENSDGSFEKIPHIGRVVIENDVEIGANTTIDRSVAGVTRIGCGVKIDNLVQIAHNVHIGENTAIAAQTGVSGSALIGRRVRLAGQVGVVGHISLHDDVVVLAQSGVPKSINEAGMYLGSPIQAHGSALRLNAVLRNLPETMHELLSTLKNLQNRISTIESNNS